jgi:hypothetical protein
MWAASSEQERARVGMHTERGPESFELMFRLIAGHDRVHHGQAVKTLQRFPADPGRNVRPHPE